MLTITTQIRILDEPLVLESAKELGRMSGRDQDWSPSSLEEAIEELEELKEGSPVSNGYEIVSRDSRIN